MHPPTGDGDLDRMGYYSERLHGRRLQRCYEIASPRVKRYLEAEIEHVMGRLGPSDMVLELGCGYGRVALRLAEVSQSVVGIDTSFESIQMARKHVVPNSRCKFACMDAVALAFPDGTFDAVICIQNGVCAFGVDQRRLLAEALRVARPGGRVILSTYSDRFWQHRLDWFEAQAAEGLLGEIDRAASGNGVIVCKDGFRAGRLTPDDWARLCSPLGLEPLISEVDESSLFCEIVKPGAR